MEDTFTTIESVLDLIPVMKSEFGVQPNHRDSEPLMFTGVAESVVIDDLTARVAGFFGSPYKPAGEGAFFKNLLDSFVKNVGGISRDQTLFRKDVSPTVTLFCAFWPWGSNPVKTSVRVGILCSGGAAEEAALEERLATRLS